MPTADALLAKSRADQSAGTGGFALFNRYLSVVRADSDELLDQVYRLRFQVYCIERKFEDAAGHPDGQERDRHDSRSLHSLVIDRISGAAVGTVRLILPRHDDSLPVFGVIGEREWHAAGLPRETTAEVSRFAVAKALRRKREKEWRAELGCAVSGPRTALDLLTFGLIRSVVMMGARGGITHIVAIMEPALLRLLARLGITFHPLGGPVEHHGTRQPSWAMMHHLIASIKSRHPQLGEIISVGTTRISDGRMLACA